MVERKPESERERRCRLLDLWLERSPLGPAIRQSALALAMLLLSTEETGPQPQWLKEAEPL